MVIKYYEYEHKLHLGIAPGSFWNPTPEIATILDHPKANIFFSIYYMMTGIRSSRNCGYWLNDMAIYKGWKRTF